MIKEGLSKCRILFVGFTVPEDIIDDICRIDRYLPVQTHQFAWSVVSGLEINGANVDLLSSEPVGVYPSNPRILFNFKKWNRGNGSWNIIIPFINLPILKHLTRFMASVLLIGSWLFIRRQDQTKCILLHGVHSPFLYAGLIIRRFSNVNIITIMTDPPGVELPGESTFTKWLRKVDVSIIGRALKQMDGLVTLTKQLSQHFAPEVPSIVIEGIMSSVDYHSPNTRDNNTSNNSPFIILYAGALKSEYGIELLLKAFSKIESPLFRLWILGKGDNADEIQLASKTDQRILFMGYRPPHEANDLLHKATVLINPRPSHQSFTHFSFPSKIIQYMASGRPVISTRLPGIPEDYFPHLFILDQETQEGLADLLIRVSRMNRKDLDNFGADGRTFIMNYKNETNQGRKIVNFILNIIENKEA
jgi:glycosyltransferase involved in cell wall biosynthesis